MNGRIRTLLAFEAVTYVAAALVHGGMIVTGYAHREARIAESAIAVVLATGLATAWLRPAWTRRAALWSQGVALFWTLVGITTIAVGVGPRTIPDVVYHIAIVGVLIYGLSLASQPLREGPRS